MNNNNLDDFLNELYENWIDTVIENVPLVENYNHNFNRYHFINNGLHIYNNRYVSTRVPTNEEDTLDILNFIRNRSTPERNTNSNTYSNIIGSERNRNLNINMMNNFRELISERRIQNENNTETPEISNLLTDLFGNIFNYISEPLFEDVKVTISEENFNKLKTIHIKEENKNEYTEKDCNICLESFNIDNELKILPCNHFFHTECIKEWLCNEKINCPICRKDIRDK